MYVTCNVVLAALTSCHCFKKAHITQSTGARVLTTLRRTDLRPSKYANASAFRARMTTFTHKPQNIRCRAVLFGASQIARALHNNLRSTAATRAAALNVTEAIKRRSTSRLHVTWLILIL